MSGKNAVLAKNDNDVVVVQAYRTAITKVCLTASVDDDSAHSNHVLYRLARVVSKILIQRNSSQQSSRPSTRPSSSTRSSSRTSASAMSSLLVEVPLLREWLHSLRVFPTPAPCTPSIDSARPVSQPSISSPTLSKLVRSTLESVS